MQPVLGHFDFVFKLNVFVVDICNLRDSISPSFTANSIKHLKLQVSGVTKFQKALPDAVSRQHKPCIVTLWCTSIHKAISKLKNTFKVRKRAKIRNRYNQAPLNLGYQ